MTTNFVVYTEHGLSVIVMTSLLLVGTGWRYRLVRWVNTLHLHHQTFSVHLKNVCG